MKKNKTLLATYCLAGMLILLLGMVFVSCSPTPTPAPTTQPAATLSPTPSPTATPLTTSTTSPAISPAPATATTTTLSPAPTTLIPSPSPTMTTTLAPSPAPTPTASATPAPTSTQQAAQSSPPGAVDPSAVAASDVTYSSESFTIKAYLAQPKTAGSYPGLIIIHENRGLTDHIRDVARRYANQGYIVIAPDLLSRVGGTAQFATTDEAVAAINGLSQEGVMQDVQATFTYLLTVPNVQDDRIGVLGYCWGGGNSLLYATRNPNLKAAVVYYGPNPPNIDDVAKITAPVLGIYGANDNRITMNVPALIEAMNKYNKPFEYTIYPGAAHAFFNDTGGNYNAEASAGAWQVTISFLQANLKG